MLDIEMSKRFRVISASALAVIGFSLMTVNFIPTGLEVNAVGLAETGVDLARYFLWGGVAILVVSALLFLSVSAD